jgi:hypothetical protein
MLFSYKKIPPLRRHDIQPNNTLKNGNHSKIFGFNCCCPPDSTGLSFWPMPFELNDNVLNVIFVKVILLDSIPLSVILLSEMLLNVILLSEMLLNVILLSEMLFNVILLGVILLGVILLGVILLLIILFCATDIF